MTRLYRSIRNRRIAGLCGGLAEMLGADAALVRLLLVIAVFFTGGSVILLYLLASLIVPSETGSR
jgi:phage shock protein PspC (stress-responsive transcriptional regulator)